MKLLPIFLLLFCVFSCKEKNEFTPTYHAALITPQEYVGQWEAFGTRSDLRQIAISQDTVTFFYYGDVTTSEHFSFSGDTLSLPEGYLLFRIDNTGYHQSPTQSEYIRIRKL